LITINLLFQEFDVIDIFKFDPYKHNVDTGYSYVIQFKSEDGVEKAI